MDFKLKYLKYKNKYLNLKNQKGGNKNIIKNINFIIEFLKISTENNILIDNINYKFWYNDTYNNLCIQKESDFSQKNYNNKVCIKINGENIEIIEGDYRVAEIQNSIPKNWKKIIDNIALYTKLYLIKTKLVHSNDNIHDLLDIEHIDLINPSTDITFDYYVRLMEEFSTLNIHESIGISDINLIIYNKFKMLFPDLFTYENAKQFIINMLINASSITYAYYYKDKDNDFFNVSTNGTMAVILKSVLNLDFKQIFLFAISMIVVINEGHTRNILKPIVLFSNQFTATTAHYHNIQKIHDTDIIFKTKGENQNFLQWFIMSMNPMSFFVPSNSITHTVLTKENIINNIKKCLYLYKILNLFIKTNSYNSYLHNILFANIYNDNIEELFNFYIEKIKIEQSECKLNRFQQDDGFGYSSTSIDMLNIRLLDELYGHQYLDPRHFLTILFGSREDTNYRNELRRNLQELTKKIGTEKSDLEKLQFFSRLKLARFEPVKLDDCIKNIIIEWKPYYIINISKHRTNGYNVYGDYKDIIKNKDKDNFNYVYVENDKKFCMINLKNTDYNIILQIDNQLNITNIYTLFINNYNGHRLFIRYSDILDEIIEKLEK